MEHSVEQRMEYLMQWWNGRNQDAPRYVLLGDLRNELARVISAIWGELDWLWEQDDRSDAAQADAKKARQLGLDTF